ncbi:MAG: DUF1553 domain-containing protein [Planctomycetota bacterium]
MRAPLALLALVATLPAQKPTPRTFLPLPDQVAIPSPQRHDWQRNAIDDFVLARLEKEGLAPNHEASRERLIRRATLTLTGLPPEPQDVAAFVADVSPDAFDHVLDRLLGSVQYAEHMTADWLDAARYADTHGYQVDSYREVWPWRDWVISTFDRNLTYDRFLTWQLAGDLLPDATRESTLATCFLRLHRQTNEGGSVEEEFRQEYVSDRVETIGTAILGVTMGCAKCHDHKNDPLTQRDYYGMCAIVDGGDECGLYSYFTDAVPTPTLRLPTAEQETALATATRRVGEAEDALRHLAGSREEAFAQWLAQQVDSLDIPGARGSFSFESIAADGSLDNGAVAADRGRTADSPVLGDGIVGKALMLSGENNAIFPKVADFARDDPFTIACFVRVAEHHDRAVVWHRSRAWTDAGSRGYELLLEDGRPSAALIHFWPGNALRVVARRALVPGRFTHIAVSYDGSSRAEGLRIFVDGQAVEVDVVRDKLTRDITGGGADALTLGQRFRDKGLRGGAIDELRTYGRELAPLEVAELARPGSLRAALLARDDADQRMALRAVFAAGRDEELAKAREALRAARRERTKVVESIREVMVMRDDLPEPRVAHRLIRGAYDAPAEVVEPSIPAVLGDWPEDAPHDRLGLARWICDPHNPLTARVIVDRVWQLHFGRGLCPTPEDLGNMAGASEYPELLDWLARRFVDSGFDLKALHRLILSSATWRQDSACDSTLRTRDPDNALLARGPSFRLGAEVIRDSALAVSGLLVRKVGGPSVKPYQPPGLWEEKSGASYTQDQGEGLWRRSLYTFSKRTSPPPAMTTFDAGSREVCSVRRQRTTSPLQALLIENDPQHVEAARMLAARVMRECTGDGERLDALFARVLSRAPTAREREILLARITAERASFAADPGSAKALLAVGVAPCDTTLDPIEVATFTTVSTTLLCLDEAITLR